MSVNQENVVGADVDKVRKLLEESENELHLVSKSNEKFHPHSQKRLLSASRYQDALVWLAGQLVDDKSVSSCQQTSCHSIVKTCYP